MTRFWLTLEQGVRFVVRSLERMQGGEIFVPKIPTTGIMEVAASTVPGCEVDFIGIRPGEKLHEVLVSEDEARQTLEYEDMYLIRPPTPWYFGDDLWPDGVPVPDGFRYSSDSNPERLSAAELRRLVEAPEVTVG
jgi:UDP-N-acetylglucosamine 4,6-dehydratase